MEIFVIGDTVQLKSGGPIMTIHKVNTNAPVVSCVWFHDGKDDYRDCNPAVLRKVGNPAV